MTPCLLIKSLINRRSLLPPSSGTINCWTAYTLTMETANLSMKSVISTNRQASYGSRLVSSVSFVYLKTEVASDTFCVVCVCVFFCAC
jgi:hypothetical protein